jgi:hypothetical protein
MSIPDSVLAAIIAGTATLSASFVQLRSALLREAAAGRSSNAARRRNRLQLIILLATIRRGGRVQFCAASDRERWHRGHGDCRALRPATRAFTGCGPGGCKLSGCGLAGCGAAGSGIAAIAG